MLFVIACRSATASTFFVPRTRNCSRPWARQCAFTNSAVGHRHHSRARIRRRGPRFLFLLPVVRALAPFRFCHLFDGTLDSFFTILSSLPARSLFPSGGRPRISFDLLGQGLDLLTGHF